MYMLLTKAALGESDGSADHLVTIFIIELLLILLIGRLLGEVMVRVRQPSVMGYLIAGILLGPSVFGALWPAGYQTIFPRLQAQQEMIQAVSQLGILLLLLLTGMEMDWTLVKQQRRVACFASLAGIFFPFVAGFLLGQVLPEVMLPDPARRQVTALFLATALAISSIKIVAVVLREVDFLQHRIGQIILTSAIIDDTVGWIIIALVGGLAAHKKYGLTLFSGTAAGTLGFLLLSFTFGPRLVTRGFGWAQQYLHSEMSVVTISLILMCCLALLTEFLGVHFLLGAFVAGMLIGQVPVLKQQLEGHLQGLIVALFAPVFFTVVGLSVDLTIMRSLLMLKLVFILILIASVGKLAGCYLGGKAGGLTGREATALALGMNAHGSTEVIVASIGLSMGVLSQEMFTLLVVMAITTTMMMPPLLRWALLRLPVLKDEQPGVSLHPSRLDI